MLRVETGKQRLEKWRAGGAFLGDQSQDRQWSHELTAWGPMEPLWVQLFVLCCCSPLGTSVPIQTERGITCLCQVAIGQTYVLKGLKWHWYMVWINTWSFGGWAGSSVVQCLFQICKALGSILSTTNR